MMKYSCSLYLRKHIHIHTAIYCLLATDAAETKVMSSIHINGVISHICICFYYVHTHVATSKRKSRLPKVQKCKLHTYA